MDRRRSSRSRSAERPSKRVRDRSRSPDHRYAADRDGRRRSRSPVASSSSRGGDGRRDGRREDRDRDERRGPAFNDRLRDFKERDSHRDRDRDRERDRERERDRDRDAGRSTRDGEGSGASRDSGAPAAAAAEARPADGSRRDNRPAWMTQREGGQDHSSSSSVTGSSSSSSAGGGSSSAAGSSNANSNGAHDNERKSASSSSSSSSSRADGTRLDRYGRPSSSTTTSSSSGGGSGSRGNTDSKSSKSKAEYAAGTIGGVAVGFADDWSSSSSATRGGSKKDEEVVLEQSDADQLMAAMMGEDDEEAAEAKALAARKAKRAALLAKLADKPSSQAGPPPPAPQAPPLRSAASVASAAPPTTTTAAPAAATGEAAAPTTGAQAMSVDGADDTSTSTAPAPAAVPPPPPASTVVGSKIGGAVVEDIFSASPVAAVATGGGKRATAAQLAMADLHALGDDSNLEDNWNDAEGYYVTRIGEVIAGRFQVRGDLGKGVFSTVLSCIDLKPTTNAPAPAPTPSEGGSAESNAAPSAPAPTLVAIKLIRNNDVMRKAAMKEIGILEELTRTDPDDRKHCVRLVSTFEHRAHTCIVFPSAAMNLRETLKKFGKGVGINIRSVRTYTRQLLISLKHLATQRIVHADLKPDNILVSSDFRTIRLCDFGSAFRESDADNDPTPYLVSRFYRAPEITLGLEYNRQIDLWAAANCVYELFTGNVMFPGRDNNHMLQLHMDMMGKFSNKTLKRHLMSYERMEKLPHFSEDFRFRQQGIDKITGKGVMRYVDVNPRPVNPLAKTLAKAKAGADDPKLVSECADLLEKMCHLEPEKRLQVRACLEHPFMKNADKAEHNHHGQHNKAAK